MTDADQNRRLDDHEQRIAKLEHADIIRDAVLTFWRWARLSPGTYGAGSTGAALRGGRRWNGRTNDGATRT